MERVFKSDISIKNQEGLRVSSEIAMVVILTSLSMLFATLFLGYAVYRVSSDVWPPYGFERLPLSAPILSTLFALLGSVCFYRFRKAWALSNFVMAKKLYFSVLTSAVLFILSQFNLWQVLKSHDLFSSSGIFGSMIYGFTWIHFGHMVLALILILGMAWPVFKGIHTQKVNLRIVNFEKFWHFLGVIWLLMFFALFVI
jgi:cytochrome c oxidase subunit III